MTDFITIIQNILEESNKNIDDLFSNVISKDTFYKYKHRNPSLQTLIKIANYLEISINYMYEFSNENKFIPYFTDQSNFYNKLTDLIKSIGISGRQFCKEMHYSKANILRYKNGVEPSIRTLIEIANYFNCTIDDLLTRKK